MANKALDAKMAALGFWRTTELAECVGFRPASLARMAGDGRVESRRIGRFLYVSAQSLRIHLGPASLILLPADKYPNPPRMPEGMEPPGADVKAANPET